MARGWHYTKFSLSSALLLSFSGVCFVLLFLSFCRFCFVFMLSLELCRFSSMFSCPDRIGSHVYVDRVKTSSAMTCPGGIFAITLKISRR